MHVSRLIRLSPERLTQLGSGLLFRVGIALSLLLDRYGVAQESHMRWRGGSPSDFPRPAEPDSCRLGMLFQPLAQGTIHGTPPDAIWMTMQPPGQSQTLPLVFTTRHIQGGILVEIDADDRWSGTGIDVSLILGHLEILFTAADRQPDRTFGETNILTEAEWRLLLHDYNGRPVRCPAATLHGLFAAQAGRTPGAVAVIDGAQTLTYRQLDLTSNRVAHQLRPFIIRPGQVVAVCGVRSAATLTVKIGLMKAGGAFLYLPPDMPPSRATLMCDIADAVCVISGRATPLRAGSRPHLVLEDLLGDTTGPDAPPPEIADEASAAYILFTSGSTGEPKGVVRPHRMNTTRITLEQRLYDLGRQDRYLLKSIAFFREVYTPLATGGTVIIARPGGELDDDYLIDLIRRHSITICSFVPSMLRVLLASSRFTREPLPIRHLFVAGEVLDSGLEAQLRALGLAVHVTYTLAEADYVAHRTGPPARDSGLPDVGKPIDMALYVCDAKGRLLPPGFVGEFLTGGAGLSGGYVNRPELTSDRFIANPFDPQATPILFRTGDLGRFGPGGQVEFAGRSDGQVKIRGQRVEITEVELAIRGFHQVDGVMVASLPDKDQGHCLAAYIVTKSGNLDTLALRAFLANRLTSVMIPSFLVQVAHLPLLPSGKADRARLRTNLTMRPGGLGPASPPEDEFERRIAGVWATVLGLDQVGIDDPFMALGGESLRLMLLRHALETELAMPIGLTLLLEVETVRDLAAQLRAAT